MSRPLHALALVVPHYDDRDGITGWSTRVLRYTQTRAFAVHLLNQIDHEDMVILTFDPARGYYTRSFIPAPVTTLDGDFIPF